MRERSVSKTLIKKQVNHKTSIGEKVFGIIVFSWFYLLPATFIYNGGYGLFHAIFYVPDRRGITARYFVGDIKNLVSTGYIVAGIIVFVGITSYLYKSRFFGESIWKYILFGICTTILGTLFTMFFNAW